TNFRAILASVASGEPDLLYFPVFEPEGPFIVAQSSEFPELEDIILMAADGLLANSFPENSGLNVVGMYLTGPHTSGAAYEDFLAEWMSAYGGTPPSGFHAFAYDATNLLLDAIEAVAVVDKDGTLHIGRQALRDYLSNISGYHGLSGEIDCSDKDFGDLGISHGDCSTGDSIAVFQITENELNGDWPPEAVNIP
ncbi:MAG: ABC transporter substrate-binding protein, partial [Anaerolineaceae bacterium]|nr:ABC transporter substrate-binding protein [Anaerolineaceae bacterium]